jgi:hypothetical protein
VLAELLLWYRVGVPGCLGSEAAIARLRWDLGQRGAGYLSCASKLGPEVRRDFALATKCEEVGSENN